MRPISAARPRIDLCTKNPPPRGKNTRAPMEGIFRGVRPYNSNFPRVLGDSAISRVSFLDLFGPITGVSNPIM